MLRAMSRDDQTDRESRTALRRLQHEMRTPLGQIIGYSEMLLEEAREEHAEFVPDLERIHHAAEQLLGVVDQTLKIDAVSAAPWIFSRSGTRSSCSSRASSSSISL